MTELDLMLAKSDQEGWTQSEITTLDDCPMMWFWRYGMLLKRKGSFSWSLVYGTAFHATMEEVYATGAQRWSPAPLKLPDGIILATPQQKEDFDYWARVLAIQTAAYVRYYRDDFVRMNVIKTEMDVDIVKEWQGKKIRLRGKIDLTFTLDAQDNLWILDFKTTSRLDLKTVAGWDFRFQFMFYLWMGMHTIIEQKVGKKFAGYYIRAIKKPSIYPKKNESWDSFYARLEGEMAAEPEKYFYDNRLLLTTTSMAHFESFVLTPKLNRILLLTNPETPDIVKETLVKNPNTNRCQLYGTCEFLPLCEHGYDLESFNFTRRNEKHEELGTEGGE